jgi:polyphosphate glucokinase
MREVLGIDVGATGIKGAIVDTKKGILLSERIKYKTPKPATPGAVLKVVNQLVEDFEWKGKKIGIGFPAIIKDGITLSASNIDKEWIGYPAKEHMESKLGCEVVLLNDADAAGLAEFKFGKGKGKNGNIILLTLGTGIGSAMFFNGSLIPNTELGQMHYKDSVTEKYAANSVREKNDLSWKQWGKELNKVLKYIEFVLAPDFIILGGGVSKKFHQYEEYLSTKVTVEPAALLNHAGIIGAAMKAVD